MSKLLKSGILAAGMAIAATGAATAADDLMKVPSPHSVADTMDRLQQAVEAAGATVFARIDHAAGGRNIGMDIPANEVLIFGNPKLGTPVIRDMPAVGLDLPLRVVVVEADDGSVLVYRSPAAMAESHGLPADHPSVGLMTGALKNLTGKASAN
ncbi:DUF302 domain-containing protein [Hoeflea prorocentri]|uniref:DUF302 domain-containing protein n=1 Tax=Hoeflea prorocentri TaxID=1922333 RepID=A0A9X3ZJM2_9HYPH|nr:DUF302 domain-containing protein [Hoeflea prorocentri]MCY6382950.1 DUF302 domain-containing protein [Hoeflea prorocentri]MDA5400750.1 DUF302 domain-containing protein [Hoeflea prorocentri]